MSFLLPTYMAMKMSVILVHSSLFWNRNLLPKSKKKKVFLYLNYFINKPIVPRKQQLEHSKWNFKTEAQSSHHWKPLAEITVTLAVKSTSWCILKLNHKHGKLHFDFSKQPRSQKAKGVILITPGIPTYLYNL